jgi:hypothetical protein
MSVTPIANPVVQQTQDKQENAPVENRKANPAATARHQLNVQILEASAKVSLAAGDNSQELIFRSAIDRINELLSPELGPNALQNLAVSQDNSPEATAERILSLSTGFYEGYARQHPGEDPEKLATDFVNLIRGGFEKGFGEARNILEGLQVFDGEVKSGVLKTYELVHQGYDNFLADKLAALKTVPTEKVDA